jgi:hypothetical protein
MSGNGKEMTPDPTVNGIAIEFPDDHDINGMKVKIVGVTPEQIMVAVWHLTRSADVLADYRTQQMIQAQQPAIVPATLGDLAAIKGRRPE